MPFKQVVFTSSWLSFTMFLLQPHQEHLDQNHHYDHTHIKQQHELTAHAPQWRLRFHWEPSMLTPTTAHKHTPLWHGLSATTSNSNKVLWRGRCQLPPRQEMMSVRLASQLWLQPEGAALVRCQMLLGLGKTSFLLRSLGLDRLSRYRGEELGLGN